MSHYTTFYDLLCFPTHTTIYALSLSLSHLCTFIFTQIRGCTQNREKKGGFSAPSFSCAIKYHHAHLLLARKLHTLLLAYPVIIIIIITIIIIKKRHCVCNSSCSPANKLRITIYYRTEDVRFMARVEIKTWKNQCVSYAFVIFDMKKLY